MSRGFLLTLLQVRAFIFLLELVKISNIFINKKRKGNFVIRVSLLSQIPYGAYASHNFHWE